MDLRQKHIEMLFRERMLELEEVALSIMAAGVSRDQFRINFINFAHQPSEQFKNFEITYFRSKK